MLPWQQNTIQLVSESVPGFRAPRPRGYEEESSPIEKDMEEWISSKVMSNITSIPSALYYMAKPVFDALPDRFLPGYKSSCWKFHTEGGEGDQLTCLPYYYILGMPKCGTSDLWDKIGGHPQVVAAMLKEPHWWTRTRLRGRSFLGYLKGRSKRLVDMFQQDPSRQGDLIAGDGSASTLWDNSQWMEIFGARKEGPVFVTADIIRHIQPNVKLFVILREPVARLYSDYLYFNSQPSPEIFHENVQRTISRFHACTARMSTRACAYSPLLHKNQGVRLLVGLYAVFIRDWFRVFPREQMYILRLEDWHSACLQRLPEIYAFLDLRELSAGKIEEICQSRTKNTNTKKAHKVGGMLNETREILQEFYSGWNRELSELLDDKRFLWQYD